MGGFASKSSKNQIDVLFLVLLNYHFAILFFSMKIHFLEQ